MSAGDPRQVTPHRKDEEPRLFENGRFECMALLKYDYNPLKHSLSYLRSKLLGTLTSRSAKLHDPISFMPRRTDPQGLSAYAIACKAQLGLTGTPSRWTVRSNGC